MAQVEPMDIDAIESDFDNKENAFQYNNVLSRTPCTEKGYEELDVSELNMKLRYSVTPGSSPMSKSLTGPSLDNKSCNDDYLSTIVGAENGNLTRSLNSSLTKTESLSKSKILPLQTLSTDPIIDSNGNSSMRRLLDQTDNNVVISVNNANELDDNLSLPSPCSSVPDTPEATTPTKDTPKPEGSPIMRGLKSVLSMFRPSQSPILPTDERSTKPEMSPVVTNKPEVGAVLVSTPVAENKQMDANSSKRSSPLKDSLVFNEDLEKQLLWKDETTIIFKDERIPVHKLFFQNPIPMIPKSLNTTVEHMDISCDESIIVENINANIDRSVTNEHVLTGESDNEFLDCETTFTKNESYVTDNNKLEMGNGVLKIGNTTVNVLNNADISQEIVPETKIVMKNTTCVIPEVTTTCTHEASVDATDGCRKHDYENNTTNIIEATINLLNSESIDYRKINVTHNSDLQNESKINKEYQVNEQNTTVSTTNSVNIDNEVINSIEDQHLASTNINDVSSNNLKEQEVKESEQNVCSDIEKLSQVCEKRLNDINDHEEINSEASHTIETNEKNGIVDNMAGTVNKIDIVVGSSISVNRITDLTNVDIGNEPNIEKPNMSNELTCSQYLNLKSGEYLSITKITQDDAIPINIDNFSSVDNVSNNVNEILGEKLSLNKDTIFKDDACKSILEDSKIIVDNILTNISPDNSKISEMNLDDDHKIIGDISVNETTECDNNTPIDTFTLPSSKDLCNSTTKPTILLETSNINVELKPEINSIHKSNDKNEEDVLRTEKESYLINKNSELNLEIKIDHINLTDNVATNNKTSTDTVTLNLPSDIPLPDEDDIEQHIFETSDEGNKDHNKQDITTLKMCELGSNMYVESELVAGNTKSDQSIITSNDITENDRISVFNDITETNSEITDNSTPLNSDTKFTCNTEGEHVIDVGCERLEQGKTMLDLDIEKNNILSEKINSNDISVPKFNDNKVDKDSSSEQISKSIVNIILEEKSPSITEQALSITETIAELNTEKNGDVVSFEKSADINQKEGGADSQKDFILEKGLDEIDEEIITSANNSPYVSVTDLDKLDEKPANDIIEEIDISNQPNATFVTTPPTSPKIVSKGYNFNFDDIEDPFATKIKIRMSPTPDSPNQALDTTTKEIKTVQEVTKKVNRRKSQHERKRVIQNKNKNSTFNDKLNGKELTFEKHVDTDVIKPSDIDLGTTSMPHINGSTSEKKPEYCENINAQCDNILCQKVDDVRKSVTLHDEQVTSSDTKIDILPSDVEIKNVEQTLVISTEKSTSSSEQYFSLGTSSCDSASVMNRSKNVFNIPEIDDLNFNPFATKSKMRMSPPLAEKQSSPQVLNVASDSSFDIQQAGSYSTINKELTFENKNGNDSLSNTSNATISSKNTNDIDSTVREIATEDEDTIEGPFLEVDDLKESKKYTDVDIESDMMNFDEIPQQERDENLENGELFIDADAFEFLLNQNKSTTVLDSGKESLFLKFDPLFAKRVSSDGILAALSKVQKRQSTPKKLTKLKQQDLFAIEKPTAGPSNIENCGPSDDYNDDLSSTVTKPMMVVNPAVSSVITQKKPATPKLNRRSLTFTSPAMAVIDRLLSLSGNSSHLENNVSIPQSGRDHSKTDLALTQLRELLAEKEINVHTLRCESKELKDRLAMLEVQVRGLEKEGAERLTKINELNERLSEKTKINKSMAIVVEEYERTIASLIAETEHDKKRNAEERMRLIKERDEQTAHLTSMEVSFSDLHSKYEKSKQIILSCKANEDVYKKSIQEFVDNFSKMQNNYELLKQHATSKLNHANQELEKMNRTHEAEVLKLNAMIKRKELHITSLEETLAQKTKANEELTAICDELINKVG